MKYFLYSILFPLQKYSSNSNYFIIFHLPVGLQGPSQTCNWRLRQHGIEVSSTCEPLNEVILRPVVDVPPGLGLNEREAVIAPGIEFSPPGLKFTSPIKVTVPHCATFSDPSRAKIKFYTRDTGKILMFYKNRYHRL